MCTSLACQQPLPLLSCKFRVQGGDHHGGAELESDAELGVVGPGDWHCSQQPQPGQYPQSSYPQQTGYCIRQPKAHPSAPTDESNHIL